LQPRVANTCPLRRPSGGGRHLPFQRQRRVLVALLWPVHRLPPTNQAPPGPRWPLLPPAAARRSASRGASHLSCPLWPPPLHAPTCPSISARRRRSRKPSAAGKPLARPSSRWPAWRSPRAEIAASKLGQGPGPGPQIGLQRRRPSPNRSVRPRAAPPASSRSKPATLWGFSVPIRLDQGPGQPESGTGRHCSFIGWFRFIGPGTQLVFTGAPSHGPTARPRPGPPVKAWNFRARNLLPLMRSGLASVDLQQLDQT